MTQDEIIEMARRVAGMITIHANGEATYSFYENQLRAFAKLVAEKEREACAKIVEENANKCGVDTVAWMLLASNAQAIRARSKHD